MIDFNYVSVGYRKELFSVEKLTLNAGKVYSLVGANGSGKSTFFKSLLGHVPFLTGELLMNTESIRSTSVQQRSKQFAFVESSFAGVEFLSVEDLILLGRTPYVGSMGRYSSTDLAVMEEVIRLFDLEQFRKLFTDKLSDGERQIAAIARAIAQETEVILLDEPTAFLDYGNKKRILNLLIRIAQEKNKIIILSTHDIDLCLEKKELDILMIDQIEKKLIQRPEGVEKGEILARAFGIS